LRPAVPKSRRDDGDFGKMSAGVIGIIARLYVTRSHLAGVFEEDGLGATAHRAKGDRDVERIGYQVDADVEQRKKIRAVPRYRPRTQFLMTHDTPFTCLVSGRAPLKDVVWCAPINHRARENKLANIAFILNIEDTHDVK
jgi:hypothetical protein